MTVSARTGSLLVGALALGIVATGDASADAGGQGRVAAATSRWTPSGDAIVTDLVVEAADGTRTSITTLGGSVDGIGMTFSHHATSFRVGDAVRLVAQGQGLRAEKVEAVAPIRLAPHAGEPPSVGVQRTSRSQRALFHTSGCIDFVYDARGTNKLPGSSEWDAVDAALAAWESASSRLQCGGVKLGGEIMADAPDGRDLVNTIRFRDDRWCRPAQDGVPELCHSPDAVGITRVLYIDDPISERDGEIIEVDIELNGVDFALATDGRAGAIDLASAVAHEIGHALGLDHNCGIEGGAWPMGLDGTLVESCESLPAALGSATMYFQITPGTTTMRSPQASDVDDLCEIVLGLCAVDVEGGCSAGGDAGAPSLLGLLAGLLLMCSRVRTSRSRR